MDMAHIPHGSTHLEVLGAIALCVVVSALLILALNPQLTLSKNRDNERLNASRDLAEAFIALRMEDAATFNELLKDTEGKRVMIASSDTCDYVFGSQCSKSLMSPICLAANALQPHYIENLPKDAKVAKDDSATGYYLEKSGETIKIGACAPDSRQILEVSVDLRAIP